MLKNYQPITFSLALIFLTGGVLISLPQTLVAQLVAPTETLAKPTLTGQEGNYVGKILINAPVAKVWQVLTDYGDFPKFLPTITAVKILETNGNHKVYEQTNVVQVFFFSQTSKIAIATTETYPTLITFQMREGENIKSLQGSWQIEVISANQVLVTNQVRVEPTAAVPRDIFFNIYSDTLIKTLSALKQKIEN